MPATVRQYRRTEVAGHYYLANCEASHVLEAAGEPREISKHRGDQFLSARILRRKGRRKQVQKVTGLFCGLEPVCGWRRDQMCLKVLLLEP